VGKTTLARVLAMALNCASRDDSGEPCGECDSCSRIWGGQTALDVVEIDAASNRGVDDARHLRERAMYAPSQEGRYKIYIVDEAHMLTREAWNALLKILEEPPPRVIFVFATTEPQKIQQTAAPILSRCQRFDFRRIGIADIMSRLSTVLDGEGFTAPDEALRTIARKADGGMRDALSLLDQVIALTGGEVTQESVRRVLGLVETQRYLEFMDILGNRQHGEVFAFVERLLDEGYDLVEFYHGLVDALRSLLRLSLGGDPPELEGEIRKAFEARLEPFQPADLVRMLSLASELESSGSLRRSANPQVLLEMLLLRLSYVDRTVTLEELLTSLGGSTPQTDPASTAPDDGDGRASGESASSPAPEAPGPKLEAAGEELEASGEELEAPGPKLGIEEVGSGAESASGVAVVPETDGSDAGVESTAGGMSAIEAWARLMDEGKGIPPGMRPFLRAAVVELGNDGALVVELPDGPGLERLREQTALRTLQNALETLMGARPEIVVRATGGTSAEKPERITPQTVRSDRLRELIQREPLLQHAVEELDLELLD
jgi:DNA polymerase-3 subunit gamma/tau